MPLFSVIIPTYNRRELLADTLESVRAQDFLDFDVVVVDNGSSDGTSGWLASHARGAKCLQSASPGPGGARNLGAREASGDYLAFLDSDDLWFPWTLATFAGLIQEHGRPALLTACVRSFQQTTELAGVQAAPPEARVHADYLASSREHFSVGAGTAVIRRDVFLRSGGFDERPLNMEDHDLALRLGCEPGFVGVTQPVTLGWRRHGGSVTMDVGKSVLGARLLISQERAGRYPGGRQRAAERRRIITAHVRPVSLECLRMDRRTDAWSLYRRTFGWHLALGRVKYLTAFPLLALRP